jgi:serine/threonine protein kinase
VSKSHPTSLGRYKLLDRISVGGMAEIFRAKSQGDAGFEKVVALKRILPHMAGDQEFVDMFIDEARTVAQLSHANICQIFEFGEEEGIYYLTLELVEGKDLKRIMEYHRIRNRALPLNVALHVISKICEALDYAHHCVDDHGRPMNIVHRDVSPQNILVSYGGEVKLIDFGIAKAMGRLTKTQAGSIKGKFGYMSPEQVSGKQIDLRSDIFACGTILYELITNDRLFKAETDIATMQMVRKAAFKPLSAVMPDTPPKLDRILQRALSREPEFRYATADELLEDLEAFVAESGASCSAQQLSRWVNEVFSTDRRRAEARAREAELSLERSPKAATQPGRPSLEIVEVEPAPEISTDPSGPRLPNLPESSVTGPALPAHLEAIAGHGTGSATFTRTEFSPSSKKPWILVAIMALVLITGGLLVFFLWPKQIGPKVVTVSVADPQPRSEALTPEARAAPPAVTAAKQQDSGVRPGRSPKPRRRAQGRQTRRPRTKTAKKPAPKRTSSAPKHASKAPKRETRAPPAASPRRAQKGLLIVASKPWARVWVDGVDTGRHTPIPLGAPLKLSPGRHVVSLYVSDKKYDFPVILKAGVVTKLIRTLK